LRSIRHTGQWGGRDGERGICVITSTQAFADYFEGIRKRTVKFLNRIPADQMAFTPHPGKFTIGDLIRHLGATETMFVRAVLDGTWAYGGHGATLGETLEEALAYLRQQHEAAMVRLGSASPEVLMAKRPTLQGHPVSAWHLLMAMAEHEVHHRSQVSQYLVALGLQAPQIFGLHIEQVERV